MKCALGHTALNLYCSKNKNDFYFTLAGFTLCEGFCFSSDNDNQVVQHNSCEVLSCDCQTTFQMLDL